MAKLIRRIGTMLEINKKKYGGKPRPYLGMSSCGEPCHRKRWYGFHWVKITKHSARIDRIFSIGHLFEAIAIKDLTDAGCKVERLTNGVRIPLTGAVGEEQEEFVDSTGHRKGHPDGRITGVLEAKKTEHILELKTMNEKNFKEFKKYGIKKSHPYYYDQAQTYMGEAKLTRTFFMAVNKNTCHYHDERIKFDKNHYEDLKRSELNIIFSDAPLEKRYPKGHYKCGTEFFGAEGQWCDYGGICHSGEEPDANCRTCDFSDMGNEGKWFCTNRKAFKKETEISVKIQRKGCEHYKKGWEL